MLGVEREDIVNILWTILIGLVAGAALGLGMFLLVLALIFVLLASP